MNHLQRQVADFVDHYQLEADLSYRVLDLASETGELAKEILKSTGYGKESFRVHDNWSRGLGDVFFSLICLANSTGISLEDALEDVLNRYRAGDPGHDA